MRRAALMLMLAACTSAPPSAPHPRLGKTISMSLPSSSGHLVRVPSAGTRSTVLDFWAPSCIPCREKLPKLLARKGELQARGAELVLVAVLSDAESTAQAEATLQSWGVNAPFLVAREETASKQANVVTLPAILVLDERGSLRWVAPANATDDDLLRALP